MPNTVGSLERWARRRRRRRASLTLAAREFWPRPWRRKYRRNEPPNQQLNYRQKTTKKFYIFSHVPHYQSNPSSLCQNEFFTLITIKENKTSIFIIDKPRLLLFVVGPSTILLVLKQNCKISNLSSDQSRLVIDKKKHFFLLVVVDYLNIISLNYYGSISSESVHILQIAHHHLK